MSIPNNWLLKTIVVLLFISQSTSLGQDSIPPSPKYAEVVKNLEAFIHAEMKAKGVPGLSIALVDGKNIVWAKGFGLANVDKKSPATAETVYPVGSISKLFTALLSLQLAREGLIDLDQPITKYLHDFKPTNPFNTPITIRQILAHRSGLVREPPIGNYFDPTNASRKDLVESLNTTTLIHRPGSRYKYSNASLAIMGYVLEIVSKKSFEDLAKAKIFEPLAMQKSTFRTSEAMTSNLAIGNCWTQYGRTFLHPTLDYQALAPAGGFFSSVVDFGRFIPSLYLGGDEKSLFHPDDLQAAFTDRFPDSKGERIYGIGFRLEELEGKKRVGHGGAVNACIAELAILPEEQLGVIVCANKESSNIVTRRIANAALSQALALRSEKPLPKLETTEPLKHGMAKSLEGRYQSDSKIIDILVSGDRAWILPTKGGTRNEIRMLGDTLMVDDQLAYGTKLVSKGETLTFGEETYKKVAVELTEQVPDKWKGLIGEYGKDLNVLFILEKDGKLHVLIEWFFLYPLEEIKPNQFRLPDYGLYPGEPVLFKRNNAGKAESVSVGGMRFKRRKIDGEDGSTFQIKPIRPIEEIRQEALKASPPIEKGEFLKPDLVDLARMDDTWKFDIRYSIHNNFIGVPFYTSARAFFQRSAAEALLRANKKLRAKGYGLWIFDSYRPWHVTKMFWEATPEKDRIFVADPSKGSRHNRGCAVDLTMYDLKTGKPVEMVGGYDEFSDRSYPDYPGGTSLQRYHRQLLRDTLESEGFTVYEAEWWHFDYKDWKKYPILNTRFEDLK